MDETSGQELIRLVSPGSCCLYKMEVSEILEDQSHIGKKIIMIS